MSGPGKERPGVPGWSQMVRPVVAEENKEINVLLHPQLQSLFATILQLLAPYPEARASIAAALAGPAQPTPSPRKQDTSPNT